jgi:hypothetical protein
MASYYQSGEGGAALAVRFDRPFEGQHATSLWLSSPLSTQAGTNHSLKAPAGSPRPRSLCSGPTPAHAQMASLC